MEEQHSVDDKKNDSKYRRYVAALEKCLQSFESVNEWADVISFLSRLGKVFNSFPTFKEIPFKLNLAKRLAQCLNPALPAGVHQKTLEIYELVFRKIGNEGLVKDLCLYSFGLFPFFEHSTTLVKNSLLELYEVYLVPLGSGLIPSLRPLVLSIILGLEEESSDYFNKVNTLLNQIKMAVGTYEFYDAIWTGLLISPHHRLAIINFILKNIPTNATNEELMEVCVNNTKLVSTALSAALQDNGQLVIRGSLEILVKYFPVEKRFFETQQLVDLFKASMNVLTRKDMSLTRRFYSWILTTGAAETEILPEYNLNILILALKKLINNEHKTSEEFSKPFKLLVFVLDKPIVSDPLLKDNLFSLAKLVIDASRVLSDDDFIKVLNSSNLLFRMLELDIIWGAFLREIDQTNFSNAGEIEKVIEVIDFAMMNLCICDDTSSMSQVHLFVNFTLRKIFADNAGLIPLTIVASLMEMCFKILKRLNFPSIDSLENISESKTNSVPLENSQNLLLGSHSKMEYDDMPYVIISNIKLITSHSKELIEFSSNDLLTKIDVFVKAGTLLRLFHDKGISADSLKIYGEIDLWLERFLAELKLSEDINVINACLNQITDFYSIWTEKYLQMCDTLIEFTLPLLWKYFGNAANNKGYICLLITTLCRILPNESDIYFASILSSAIRNRKYDVILLFTEFWDLSVTSQFLNNVPLRISVLILVDSMTNNEFRFKKCSYSWIFSISKYLDRFLVPALSSFIDILECGLNEASNSAMSTKKAFRKNFDKDPLIYYLNIIERLLEVSYENVHNYLAVTDIDSYLMIQLSAFADLVKRHLNIDFEFDYRNNYLNLLLILCIPLIAMEDHKAAKNLSSPVRVSAINVVCSLLKNANYFSLPLVRILIDFSIFKLNFFTCNLFDIEKQSHFLNMFNCLLSNGLIASLLSDQDINYLIETSKKALELSFDADNLQEWGNFLITLCLLPNSNVDLIITVLNGTLVHRIKNNSENLQILSPTLLSAIFLCITKLSIFYLAAKSNVFSSSNHLKNSISCLLNDVKTDANTALSNLKLSGTINLEDFEKILESMFEAQVLLDTIHSSASEDTSTWSNCSIVLKESCHLLYTTNRGLITEVLLSIFSKKCTSGSKASYYSFLAMFYDQETSEFIRATLQYLKPSKDTWRNHEIILKFLLEFGKNETNESVILEIWSLLTGQIKDFYSSSFKFKSIMWLLIENCCHLMAKIDKIDSSRILKDFDLLMKLFENSFVYAAKLNDSAQWIVRPEELVDISSERFKEVLIESVKDKNVARCMISVCQTLIPSLPKYFREMDKLNIVMNPIIVNLVTPNFKSPLRYSLMGQISCFFFENVLKLNLSSTKAWKRDLWEAFLENSFLTMPHFYFSALSDAFRIITQEPDKFSEILYKFSTSTTASMFLSKDAEILSKALNIRRLSFLTFWGNFDVFRIHLPSLQEKLVELIRYYNGFVLGEIFFLIRVFLLRLNDESISSLWPLIMTELVQLFENSIKSEQLSQADLYALFQACKLIDMMLTLRTSSILLYHWLFFDSSGKEGLFMYIDKKFRNSTSTTDASPSFSSLKRRPLLSFSSVKDIMELLPFFQTAGSHLSHDFIMIQNLDMDFIDKMTERDLLEPLEIK